MTLQFDGELTQADHKQHTPLRFTVPEGVGRLDCRFEWGPYRAEGALFDNLLTLSLFGPNGARGVRHNCGYELSFFVEAGQATPGYQRGVIEPGEWMVTIDGFRILGPDPIRYRLSVVFSDAAAHEAFPLPPPAVPDRGAGWYKGDLHAHSDHSDASWTVAEWAAWARRRGLDFAVLSDHNTVSQHEDALGHGGADLLVIGGNELTTHYGHALTVGLTDWQEWRAGSWPGVTMPDIANDVMGKGGLFVIAHPEAPGDPACTGCHWDFADMRPGPARLVEIWNGGPWSDYNEDGLALYRSWLDQGHRLRATAGTDIHGPTDDAVLMGFNHVFADQFTKEALLAAVERGENYLSSGPSLVLLAFGEDGATAPMGGELANANRAVVNWNGADGPLTLRIVCGTSAVRFESEVAAEGRLELPLSPRDHWIMAELRDADGHIRAVTNPIFLGDGSEAS
jgi:hypothetical protein